MELRIDRLTLDADCQPRVKLDEGVAEDYAEALRAGCLFPPVVVFKEARGGKAVYRLASGWHRLRAHQIAGRKTIQADVRDGDKRAAVLFSVGTNTKHGLRRDRDDKWRAVTILLSDPEWGTWSAREIARRCDVSEGFVRTVKAELSAHETQIGVKVLRGGTVYTMQAPKPRTRAEQVAAQADETARQRPLWLREAREGLEAASRALTCLGDQAEALGHVKAALSLLEGRKEDAA